MIEKVYKNFIEESEMFFVNKFIESPKIKKKYCDCLDIVFNISNKFDSNRGLIAFNKQYGNGKSFFFNVIHHRIKRTKNKNLFVKTSAKELCEIYMKSEKNVDPQEHLKKFIGCKNLFIDDIGEELMDGHERIRFGNKLNVVRWVLLKRYEFWIEKGFKTFGTTNLSIEEIAENYGGRVADRILQMCYIEKFDFLKKGSFRQLKETRQLSQNEIDENIKKLTSKDRDEIKRPDLIKYFNELIDEDDSYFKNRNPSWWSFVKDFLIEKEILNKKSFDQIDEKMLDSSKLLMMLETRRSERSGLKHAPGNVRNNSINEAIGKITKKQIWNTAENIVAQNKFMELRKNGHRFD